MIQIIQLLQENQHNPALIDMVMKLIASLELCLKSGARCRLPSAVQNKVWSSFHTARLDQAVVKALSSYTSVSFQLIFDRLMKALIAAHKNDRASMY